MLQAQQIAFGASGRNGEFCEASLTHGFENGLARWPDEIETLERLGRENLDAIAADKLSNTRRPFHSNSETPEVLRRRKGRG